MARRGDDSETLERPPFTASAEPGTPVFASIELIFFAFRGFASDADHLLAMVDAGGREKIASMAGAGRAASEQR